MADNPTARTLADLAITGDANDLVRAVRVLTECITGPIADERELLTDLHHSLTNLNSALAGLHRHNEIDRSLIDMLQHGIKGSADMAQSLASLERETLTR